MPITALPESTVKLLGSAQVLTTPISLVKELVDNALDAKATKLEILISHNTLDRIQIRDNGHGIPLEDLSALGKRGHTSKLRSFEELQSIGGISLGFRGEALFSAVHLGEVSITTRTDSEAVATEVVLMAQGGISSHKRASHPVGTTVCVTNFMARIPVRKQAALKSASKTLVKVKELLQAYALARPSVRFIFKIAKETKGSWSYAPRPNDGIKETVSQVISKDVAAQCIGRSVAFPGNEATDGPTNISSDQFQVDVFLPRPDADPSKLGGGQYISIDSRPVSHEKGTMKKITTNFKSLLRGAFQDTSEIKSPFIRLSIMCPVASYDPNVDPAKDDVIFANESLILESLEILFKDIYGERKSAPVHILRKSLTENMDNFKLLFRNPALPALDKLFPSGNEADSQHASKGLIKPTRQASPLIEEPTRAEATITSVTESASGDRARNKKSRWVLSMSNDFAEDVGDGPNPKHGRSNKFKPPGPARNSIPQRQPDSSISVNPWLIAKMTPPLQQNRESRPLKYTDSKYLDASMQSPLTSSLLSQEIFTPYSVGPDTSGNQNITKRTRPRFSNGVARDSTLTLFADMTSPGGALHTRRHSSENTNLIMSPLSETNSRLQFDPLGMPLEQRNALLATHSPDTEPPSIIQDSTARPRPQTDFITTGHMTDSFPITPPTTQKRSGPKQSNGLNKLFIPPSMIAYNDKPRNALRQTTLIPHQTQNAMHQIELQKDLEWSMGYEGRKENATRRHREDIRLAQKQAEIEDDGVIRSSPHRNRYNAAVTALQAGHLTSVNNYKDKEPLKISIDHNDPRAYLIKQQRLMVAQQVPSKLTRTKSLKLPLERIPKQSQTHTLLLTMAIDVDQLRNISMRIFQDDLYVARGVQSIGLDRSSMDTTQLIGRMKVVVSNWMARGDTEGREVCEVEYSFENLMKFGSTP